jgi:hypothetical protein
LAARPQADDEKYAEQIQTNILFNRFIDRLRLAWQGRNTTAAQLVGFGGGSMTTPYSEEPHEDEALPLGPYFQVSWASFGRCPCLDIVWPCLAVVLPCFGVVLPCSDVVLPCLDVVLPCLDVVWPCSDIVWPCLAVFDNVLIYVLVCWACWRAGLLNVEMVTC